MATLAFYIFSFFLLSSGTAVVLARNPVHAVLFLILGFFNAAGIFILLGAEFLAMILVVVYVGAVAVLFLFVVMMLDITPRKEPLWFTRERWVSFTKGLKELVLYSIVWGPACAGFLYGISWLASSMSGNEVSYLINGYIPTALAFVWSAEEVPRALIMVSSVIVVASILLARVVAIQVTHVNLFHAFDRLLRGIPVTVIAGGILTAELLGILTYWSTKTFSTGQAESSASALDSSHAVQALASMLYKDFVFVFLMAGVILLVAMIGAIVLTLRKRPEVRRQDISRQLARRKEDTIEIRKVKIGEGI